MNVAHIILSAYAGDLAKRISKRTIAALQKMNITLSGDDSELGNSWNEICVQVQGEQSYFWDAYDETTRSIVGRVVDGLKVHEKQALWLQCDPGSDWLSDDRSEAKESPPVFDGDIVEYIVQEYIYKEAGSWSNRRIRGFFDRHDLDGFE